MTQAELASEVGVSRAWVVRLERGQHTLEAQLVLDAVTAVGLGLELVRAAESSDSTAALWTALDNLSAKPSQPEAGTDG